jgi:hypothetical protein
MIYIFKVIGTEFVKLGFTHGNPWTRVATGFWSPPEGLLRAAGLGQPGAGGLL